MRRVARRGDNGRVLMRRSSDGVSHGNVVKEKFFVRRVRRRRGRGRLRRPGHEDCLAHTVHKVTREAKGAPLVAALAEGRVPLYGPGLEELVEGGVHRGEGLSETKLCFGRRQPYFQTVLRGARQEPVQVLLFERRRGRPVHRRHAYLLKELLNPRRRMHF